MGSTLKMVGVALLLVFVIGSGSFQLWQLYNFIHAGPRFTAYDGHELCMRVAALEPIPQPCPFPKETK